MWVMRFFALPLGFLGLRVTATAIRAEPMVDLAGNALELLMPGEMFAIEEFANGGRGYGQCLRPMPRGGDRTHWKENSSSSPWFKGAPIFPCRLKERIPPEFCASADVQRINEANTDLDPARGRVVYITVSNQTCRLRIHL